MKPILWTVEDRKLSSLTPYDKNPRQISKEQFEELKKSFYKFDYVELIAIQPNGQIIAGHMRYRAMLAMGWKDRLIPVRVADRTLSDAEMREYLIRSNANTGYWDYDILANEFDADALTEWGLSIDGSDCSEDCEGGSDVSGSSGVVKICITVSESDFIDFEAGLDALLKLYPDAVKKVK
jgi:hypothetical protein